MFVIKANHILASISHYSSLEAAPLFFLIIELCISVEMKRDEGSLASSHKWPKLCKLCYLHKDHYWLSRSINKAIYYKFSLLQSSVLYSLGRKQEVCSQTFGWSNCCYGSGLFTIKAKDQEILTGMSSVVIRPVLHWEEIVRWSKDRLSKTATLRSLI